MRVYFSDEEARLLTKRLRHHLNIVICDRCAADLWRIVHRIEKNTPPLTEEEKAERQS